MKVLKKLLIDEQGVQTSEWAIWAAMAEWAIITGVTATGIFVVLSSVGPNVLAAFNALTIATN